MVVVTFKQAVNIDTQRGEVVPLVPGTSYVLTDYHVGKSIPRALCKNIAPYTAFVRYDGRPLEAQSLLVLWLAGLGDTVAAAPALLSLQRNNLHARIDIASAPKLFEIFACAGFNGQLLNYPTTAAMVGQYDYFLPIERTSADPACLQIDSVDFRAKLLYQPAGLSPVPFLIDESIRNRMELTPSSRMRVGVQVRALSPLRSYPPDLLAEVMRKLVQDGYELHLMGQEGDCDVPPAPPILHNHCGLTKTFAEMVALVEQMDVMICPDSFLMHLAGAMSIPTVALFSTIPARIRVSRYPLVTALEPDADCAPCMAIEDDQCPQGHGECLAMRSPALSPSAVVRAVEAKATQLTA